MPCASIFSIPDFFHGTFKINGLFISDIIGIFSSRLNATKGKTRELTAVSQSVKPRAVVSHREIQKDEPGEAHDFDSSAHVQRRHDKTAASYVRVMHASR